MGRIIELPQRAARPGTEAAAKADSARTGAQRLYEALRDQIMCLDLPPGAALEESQLCRAFKVSRTPVREALIRLASDGLVELNPNRGARVSTINFVDVVDHYEAMDVFLPVACHFAAVRRTDEDLERIHGCLASLDEAVERSDSTAIIVANYALHSAIAAACHNRCIERGYRQMLTDKQRLAQHGLPGTTFDKGRALADRFRGTARLSAEVVKAIERQDAEDASRQGARLNAFVRSQVIDVLSSSLGRQVEWPLPHAAPKRRSRVPQPSTRAKSLSTSKGQKKARP
jgi:DNA-binding GntR family transcriptional regulator